MGEIFISCNPRRKNQKITGIGTGLRTKVNASIGTSHRSEIQAGWRHRPSRMHGASWSFHPDPGRHQNFWRGRGNQHLNLSNFYSILVMLILHNRRFFLVIVLRALYAFLHSWYSWSPGTDSAPTVIQKRRLGGQRGSLLLGPIFLSKSTLSHIIT